MSRLPDLRHRWCGTNRRGTGGRHCRDRQADAEDDFFSILSLAKNMSVPSTFTFRENSPSHAAYHYVCVSVVRLLGSEHQAVAVENLALRLQLTAYRRKRRRPVLTQWDRLFWVSLSQVWSRWRHALVFVQPDTVVRWQRERFRRFGPDFRGRMALVEEGRLLPARSSD